ncbi:MAG TPA: DedA family protein [Candidatus Aquilonibacter sp.]|nr:DedA family protein [Candidatus Aquilonibacter sp.]
MTKLIVFLTGLSVGAKYTLVLVLMAAQSACVPIPSEVIMPFAGAQLAHSQADLILLAVLASLASNIGSIPAYWVGAIGGRPAVERFGRYVLLGARDLDRTEIFFAKYGSLAVLIGRMLPIIRTFIALPAGIARMNQVRFHVYTFIGSLPWCYALAYFGMRLGDKWQTDPRFKEFFHRFHLGVEAAIVLGAVVFVWSHWKHRVGAEDDPA